MGVFRWGAVATLGVMLFGACSLLSPLDGFDARATVGAATGAGGGGGGGPGGNGGTTSIAAGGSGGIGGEVGTGGTGGSGGDGGTSQTTPTDWSPSFDALYLFDGGSSDLGEDSSPSSIDLNLAGLPLFDTGDPPQGAGAVSFASGSDYLSREHAVFQVGPTDSFTFGGWFKASGALTSFLIGRMGTTGYVAEYLGDGSGKCFFSDGVDNTLVYSSDAVFPADTWTHFVCRHDANTMSLAAFANGLFQNATGDVKLSVSGAEFRVSDPNTPLFGLADEAFFVLKALSNDQVLRIFACGVDGSLCTCAADPTDYEHCGRKHPTCGPLPPCNAAAP